MNAEAFANWFRHQGYHVIRTPSSYWYRIGPRIYQAFPYHWIIMPSEEEIKNLLMDNRAIAVRYSTPVDANAGVISYHVTYEKRDYSLVTLPKKARHDVRRGMDAASIEPISFARLGGEGWLLRADTLQRQGRVGAETLEGWQNLCQSAHGLQGFETWAAIVNSQLAASLIAFTSGDCCSILYQQSRTEFLPLGVNNALTFIFTNEILKRPGNHWLFYGLHSLDAPPSVDEFKFRMGYTAKPVRQRVVLNPYLRPLFNSASHAVLRAGLRLRPGNPTMAKAEGMLRFYLQGRLPISMQILPEPLRGQVFLNS